MASMSTRSCAGDHPRRLRVLVIDDEANMRHMLGQLLEKSGYGVEGATDGRQAIDRLRQGPFDFIFCDIKMPVMDGMEFLKAARGFMGTAVVIMMSAYGTIDTAVEAMSLGAYDYISKPFKTDEVILTLKKAEERENLRRENRRLRECIQGIDAPYSFGSLIAASRSMRDVFQLAAKVAGHKTTVLISGESGTGKELVARGIHSRGNRAERPLVPVNCGSIPETLLESELFGHVRGAFTGADRSRQGLFEEADGGTIFLDEIGELPMPLQVKLLRVLQESEIRPLGDPRTRRVDVRVIAATARDLKREVGKANFREDLFYRLNVVHIRLPPLRARPEDIPVLCRLFLKRYQERLGKKVSAISPEGMALLLRHDWPGNVRELENVIERAVVLTDEPLLGESHLPWELAQPGDAPRGVSDAAGYSLKAGRRELEKRLIAKALEATGGNRSRAARLLEISHPSLLSKIKLYGID